MSKLPPLPPLDLSRDALYGYTADQMRAYAEQTKAAERERCARPAETQEDDKRDREVMARWMLEAVAALADAEQHADDTDADSMRALRFRGQRLVDAVLRPNVELTGRTRSGSAPG